MTATGPFGGAALSSAGVSIRPRNAGTPSTSKKRPLTYAPSTGTARPPCARSKLSRDQAKAPSNRSSARALISSHTGYDHDPSVSSARLPGSRTGSGRMMRLLKIENSDVLAPIPSASVPITTAEKPALLRNPRTAARTSCRTLSSTRIDPHVACVLDGERDVAHRPPARPRRGVGREAVTLERVLTKSAVRLDLVTQIGVVARAAEEVQQPAKKRAHERTFHPLAVRLMSTRARAGSRRPCDRTRRVRRPVAGGRRRSACSSARGGCSPTCPTRPSPSR